MDDNFKEQMARLFGNWLIFDEDIQVAKLKEFRGIWEEVGEQRFTAGVSQIINEGHYKLFPIVSEFRAYVPAPWRKPYCDKCADGWRYVDENYRREVLRCECRRTA